MRYIIFIIALLVFGYSKSIPHFKSCAKQGIANQSALYNKWFKQWGEWDFKKAYQANNSAGNKEYTFDTGYIIIDMINQNDLVGLQCMYEKLKSDTKHDMRFINGIATGQTFEEVAIKKANFKALKFLFENNIASIDTMITSDDTQDLSLLAYATQKFQEAQEAKNTQSIENYQKIIELLKQYGTK